MNTFKLRAELDTALRDDCIHAINELLWAGKLTPNIHYRFTCNRRGRWGVEFWQGPRDFPHGEVVWTDCVELIAAAGPLKLIRGISE